MRASILACALAVLTPAAACAEPQPSPASRESLGDAWWTGPLLAPSAGTLPRGHFLVEPYFYDVNDYGAFDRHGTRTPSAHSQTYGSLTYVIYGLTDRFNVGIIPTFGRTISPGSASGAGIGDWSLLAQYGLTKYRAGGSIATTAISVQETVPTGRFDDLGTRPNDGQGNGAYSTKVGLYSQTYFWMPNGRILRARLNLTDTFSNSVAVRGTSVYGTDGSFEGRAYPGSVFSLDAALEYSATQRWVLANDVLYTYAANTRVIATGGLRADSGDGHSLAVAPALEYNWSPNVGVIGGVRLFPSGINTSESVTTVFAINYVH